MERISGRDQARNLGGLAPALLIALSLASALRAQAPVLSKEYIRLGGRILAIEQAASPGYVAPVYENWAYLNTAPTSGWVVVGAGEYTVKLAVDGKSFTQALTVKMDPRVKTPPAGLKQQFDLAMKVVEMMGRTKSADKARLNGELSRVLEAIEGADSAPTPQMAAAVADLEQRVK